MRTLFYLVFFLFFAIPGSVIAQNERTDTIKKDTTLYVVTKHDGTEYIGKILNDDGREVLIETQTLGKIYIPKSEVRSIVRVKDASSIIYGEYQSTGPFTTRYCFTTNALPIRKGENYALINLYGPEVHFALSDHFSLGIMSTWIASPMVAAAKYSFATKNEKLNWSVGTLMGTSGYLNMFRGFGGLHFANVTLGDRKNNVTFAAGYGYVRTGSYAENSPVDGVYYDSTGMGFGYQYKSTTPTSMVRGPIFSVAGIAKVGAKASFVFDSMIGVFSDEITTETVTVLRESSWNGNLWIPGSYKSEVITQPRTTVALFIMPAMRFQKSEKQAFQVALAGVALFRSVARESGGQVNNSFPFPMCTWFFRF